MFRIDIVGLTLAEIALALLFSFMAVVTPSMSKSDSLEAELKRRDTVEAQMRTELNTLRKRNQELLGQYSAARPELRSRATPSCIELGKSRGPIFVAIIRGRDRFEIDGQTQTLNEVLVTTESAVTSARADGCRQTVQVYCGSEVAGVEYEAALRSLETYFYTRKSGPK